MQNRQFLPALFQALLFLISVSPFFVFVVVFLVIVLVFTKFVAVAVAL